MSTFRVESGTGTSGEKRDFCLKFSRRVYNICKDRLMYKVLFVDDEPWAIIDLLHSIPWKDLGFDVIGYYEHALEAKEAVLSKNPHLIFVDINMPVINGFELIRQCKEAGSFAEFVILSAYSDFEFAKEAIKAEVLDYCLKPINPVSMITMLEDIRARLEKKNAGKKASGDLPEDAGYVSEGEARFNRIIVYVKSHYNTKLSLRKLADEFAVNKNYICCLFRKYTGSTFSNYLIKLRIEKSKQLLETSDMPMNIIAERIGFMDGYYFNRVFKSACGIPPHKYRMMVKKAKFHDT